MERMFTSRTQRVQDVCRSIRARRDRINTSLFELEKKQSQTDVVPDARAGAGKSPESGR